MKKGDVFTLDADAAAEVGKATLEGVTFSISREPTSVAVFASRWVTDDEGVGRPQAGRPRKFSPSLVARLLGEELEEVAETAEVEAKATPADSW